MKDLKEPKGAKMLRARVQKMLKKADMLLQKLEEDRKNLDQAGSDTTVDEATELKKFFFEPYTGFFKMLC